jgi:hypothetical protein
MASLPTNVRWGILIPHYIGLCVVNSASHVDVWVDVVGGNKWFINRVDQNVMGNFNSPSHVGWTASQQMCDGEF